MHECGHALYGQGAAPELERTGLERAASSAIHESQSRLWENLVGTLVAVLGVFLSAPAAGFPTACKYPAADVL